MDKIINALDSIFSFVSYGITDAPLLNAVFAGIIIYMVMGFVTTSWLCSSSRSFFSIVFGLLLVLVLTFGGGIAIEIYYLQGMEDTSSAPLIRWSVIGVSFFIIGSALAASLLGISWARTIFTLGISLIASVAAGALMLEVMDSVYSEPAETDQPSLTDRLDITEPK